MLKPSLLLTVFALGFAYGVGHLFALRFQTGDVYPPYSSLRADPLGTKGLHDALEELPHLDVRRNYRAIRRLHVPAPPTLLYLGTPHRALWGEDELRNVEGLLTDGARVVIAFFPIARGPKRSEVEKEKKKEAEERARVAKGDGKQRPADGNNETLERTDPKDGTKAGNEEEEKQADAGGVISFREVAQRWGFAFEFLPVQSGKNARVALLRENETAGLEERLSWHSALCFSPETDAWKVLYECEGEPVLMERKYNRGTIVLAADSYFLSNEAIRRERSPALLAWLFGDARVVVFDEESHGIRADPGIAHLVRKYHLHGVIAGLLLMAFLFVWKNSSPLVPAFDDRERATAAVIGKRSEEGLVNLLRRSIPRHAIIRLCAEEWRRAFDRQHEDARAAAVIAIAESDEKKAAHARNPVETYRAMSRAVADHKLSSSVPMS